ncbi:MAG: hypothetical protein STSR0007_00810 [Thermovirga sp.]
MKQEKLVRTLYFFFTACIILGAVFVYKAWWDRYFRLRPEIAVAEPAVFPIDVPMEGFLLWEEEVMLSPVEGTISFPKGTGPVYCAKGDIVVVVSSRQDKRSVRMPRPGYFLAAIDGCEGKWTYGSIWTGTSSLPGSEPLRFLTPGAMVRSGDPLGKFIPQPQELRCVAYLDKSAFTGGPDSTTVEIRRTASELPFHAELRAAKDLGPAIKVYLTLPFFSGEDLRSRRVSFLFHSGKARGVTVPESAVTLRERKRVVFVVTGDRSRAVEVSGIPVSGKLFLVESGLAPGDLVIVSGAEAEEGEIRIW